MRKYLLLSIALQLLVSINSFACVGSSGFIETPSCRVTVQLGIADLLRFDGSFRDAAPAPLFPKADKPPSKEKLEAIRFERNLRTIKQHKIPCDLSEQEMKWLATHLANGQVAKVQDKAAFQDFKVRQEQDECSGDRILRRWQRWTIYKPNYCTVKNGKCSCPKC